MRFLQHFAEFAGADGRGKSLFLVFVEIVVDGLAMAGMGYGFELLAVDDLFFNVSRAGGVGGDGGNGAGFLFGRGLFFLLFAEAEEAEVVRRQGVNVVRGRGVGFGLGTRLRFDALGFELRGCELVGRVLSRSGLSDGCLIEVAAAELVFVLAGFELRVCAGHFEVGFLGLLDELDLFDVMRGVLGWTCRFVLGRFLLGRFVQGRFVLLRLCELRLGGAVAMAGDGLAGEQAAAVPLDGGVDERGGLGEAGGAHGSGRLGCAGSFISRCAAVFAERFAGKDEGSRLRRRGARGSR